jgi:hypothetical protein
VVAAPTAAEAVALGAVSLDGGATWQPAEVEPRRQHAWQRFQLAWRAPAIRADAPAQTGYDQAVRPSPPGTHATQSSQSTYRPEAPL